MIAEYLPFVLAGATSGSIFATAALGLVLTQRTSGVFNFAHGAVAAIGAYAFHDLAHELGLPWPVALVLAVVGVGALTGLVLELCTRALAGARPVMRVVATVGLLLAITGLIQLRYGSSTLPFPQFLPASTFEVRGTFVGYDQLITIVVSAIAAIGLSRFMRSSRTGIAMRGVVDDPQLVGLAGINPTLVRRASWVTGSSFAALGGVLIAPFLGLDAFLLTLLVVQAFAAAAVGRFASLPLTYAGGIGIGVAIALADKLVATRPDLSGLPSSIPFLVLFGLLALHPGWLATLPQSRWTPPVRDVARRASRWWWVAAAAALLVAPHVVGARLPLLMTGAAMSVVFLSLGLLVWTAGQISLSHAAFVGVGAAVFSHVAGAGVPYPVALVIGGLATVPFCVMVALPAIRLASVYLALATLGFGILMQQLVFPLGAFFGRFGQRSVPRPVLPFTEGTSDVQFFYVQVAIAAACFAIVAVVLRTRLGRLLRAVGDDPVSLETHGTNTSTTRVLVFCIAGFLAGIAGALLGGVTEVVDGSPFGPFTSLTWIGVIAIAGRSPMQGAVGGAVLLALLPGYLEMDPAMQTFAFGVSAVIVAVVVDSGHASRAVRRGLDAAAFRRDHRVLDARRAPSATRPEVSA